MRVPTPGQESEAAKASADDMRPRRQQNRLVFMIAESAQFTAIEGDTSRRQGGEFIGTIENQARSMIGRGIERLEWQRAGCRSGTATEERREKKERGRPSSITDRPSRLSKSTSHGWTQGSRCPERPGGLPEGHRDMSHVGRQVGEGGYATLPIPSLFGRRTRFCVRQRRDSAGTAPGQ